MKSNKSYFEKDIKTSKICINKKSTPKVSIIAIKVNSNRNSPRGPSNQFPVVRKKRKCRLSAIIPGESQICVTLKKNEISIPGKILEILIWSKKKIPKY